MGKHFFLNSIDDQYEKARIGAKYMTLIRREAATKKKTGNQTTEVLSDKYIP